MKLWEFTVYATPIPQGSLKAFVRGKRAMLTSDNTKLKPYRQAVASEAINQHVPMIGKHEPVKVELDFYFAKPPSATKKRVFPTVKPDVDKLQRATFDALTGILYLDDAQIVDVHACKLYGLPERVVIRVYNFATAQPALHEEAGA